MKPRDSALAAIVLGCWAAVYLPPLVTGHTLPARDVAATQLPWRTVWSAQVGGGHLPLWDPSSDQGRPLLANPNAMAAYPGTLLFLFLDPEEAAAWHIALHHLLLLLGCALLARRSGGSLSAACVAAAATATTGVAWSSITFLNTQASLAWAVMAMATAVPPPSDRRLRRALLAGATLGLAFLAGEPVVAALGALAWTAVVVSTWRWSPVGAVAVAAAAAFAVSAPVLMPLAAVYPDTMRGVLGTAPGALGADALAPHRWIELLLPSVLGPPLGDGATGFWAAPSFPWQRYFPLLFVGAVPLLTVPFARRSGRPLGIWLGLVGSGIAGAMLLGSPPIAAAVARAPGLDALRYGVKLLLVAVMAMPPLVAAGYDRLASGPASRRRAAAGTLLAAAAILAAIAFAAPTLLRSMLGGAYPRSAASLAGVPDGELRRWVGADAAALAIPAATLCATGAAAPIVAAALVANVLAGRGVLAFDSAARWRRAPALVESLPPGATVAVLAHAATPRELSGNPALDRFWRARAALVPEYGTRWGLTYVLTRGPDGLEPVLQELLAAETAHREPEDQARVAAALGARAVIADTPLGSGTSRRIDGVWLSDLTAAAPAYLAQRLLPCQGIPAAVQALAAESFRPGADAVVSGTGGATRLGGGAVAEATGPPHRRRFAVRSTGPGLLVVRQNNMRCWRARVDGAAVPVEVANGDQIAVRVLAGAHVVELYVDPVPAQLGMLGPLLVALALVATRRGAPSRGRRGSIGDAGRNTPATPPAP